MVEAILYTSLLVNAAQLPLTCSSEVELVGRVCLFL